MLILMQLIAYFQQQGIDTDILQAWCENVEIDSSEIYELNACLDNELGIELTDRQLESLVKVSESRKYISAFKISALRAG